MTDTLYASTAGPTTINVAKDKVLTRELAVSLCGPGGLKQVAPDKLKACCPLPDHEDHSPSFVVYLDSGSWYCFGCQRGGDVVDLAAMAWGYSEAELPMAAAELLTRFGHEVPPVPRSRQRKWERQAPVRDVALEVRKKSFRRRTFKMLVMPYLLPIDDSEERRRELEAAWRDYQDSMGRLGL